uniref:hypothetical protein n=1 Tax=Ornithobacterium rhinotracheale TaxID=28251 RepID=UPI0039A4D941
MKKIKNALLAIFAATALFSCVNDDSAPTPTDVTKDKGHDEWSKVEITFKEGHLHGASFHGDPDYPETIKFFRREQKISFTQDEKGNVVPSTDKPILFLAGNSYAVLINYYNKAGELMNSDFVKDGMDKIHQHFFYLTNIKPTHGNKAISADDLMTYTYRDSDTPINEGKPELKKRTWDSNNPNAYDPIGLKGYFTVPKDHPYYTFDLKILLAHFKVENKLNKNNKNEPYAYNDKPAPGIYDSDLYVSIPVDIYSSINFQETEELKENVFFPDAAKAYGISVEDIKKDYDLIFELDPEGGNFWL